MADAFILADEIARRMKCHQDTFMANRKVFEADGFPRPVSPFARPLRWRRKAVLAWMEDGDTQPQTIPADQTPPTDNVVSLERQLRARSAAGR